MNEGNVENWKIRCDVCGKVILDVGASRMDVERKRMICSKGLITYFCNGRYDASYEICEDCLNDFYDYFDRAIRKRRRKRNENIGRN